MGRKAKLRQDRKQQDTLDLPSKEIVPDIDWSKFITVPAPKPEPKKASFLDKIKDKLIPFPKVDMNGVDMQATEFFNENDNLLGAASWSGYLKTQRKGAVLVQLNNPEPQIDYISRQSVAKKTRKFGVDTTNYSAIEDMLEAINPETDVFMIYVNQDSEVVTVMHQPEISPEQSYENFLQNLDLL
jgi:hypothetical protein